MPSDAVLNEADRLIGEFEKNSNPKPAFEKIERKEVVVGLRMRIRNPFTIYQGQTGLCGPTAVIYGLALHNPIGYVQLVADLYDKGEGLLGKWTLKPCLDLKRYALPATSEVPPCDWIPTASLRDSGNWFFDFQEADPDGGGTKVHEIVAWMKKAGYTKITEKAGTIICEDAANLQEASKLFDADYNVIMKINADLLAGTGSTWSFRADHFVVLAAPVVEDGKTIQTKIFSWGDIYSFPDPARKLTGELKIFLKHYYGYIACQY
jgi:hypothetical protein